MVGGVFSQHLGATGNPATKNAQDDASNGDDNKDKQNRLRFVEVDKLTHPSNHRSEKFTDQGKQSGKNGSSSALKSSSFHKNIYGHLSRTEQENQHRENSSEHDEIANLGDRENAEAIL